MRFKFYNILLLSFFLNLYTLNDTIESIESSSAAESNLNQKKNTQSVPLTEEEAKNLLESLTTEEKIQFQNFFNDLANALESVREKENFKKIESLFENKGISLNIVLSVIPSKVEEISSEQN